MFISKFFCGKNIGNNSIVQVLVSRTEQPGGIIRKKEVHVFIAYVSYHLNIHQVKKKELQQETQ